MTPPFRCSRITQVTAALATALFLGACRNPPDPATAGPGYVELYQQGRFAEAESAAAARAKRLTAGAERDQAMLIAGESAHAQDKDAAAENWLKPLLDSRTPAVAGRAAAVLGLLQQEAAMHNRAIHLFEQSQGKLTGNDAARAAIYAGDSYRALDKTAEAKVAYQNASRLAANDATLRAMIADRLSGTPATVPQSTRKMGGFTLQLGAFSSLSRAQATADRWRVRLATSGLGAPRIVETSVKSQRTYVVQAGRFTSRQAAEAATSKLGTGLYVTNADD